MRIAREGFLLLCNGTADGSMILINVLEDVSARTCLYEEEKEVLHLSCA